MFSRLVGIFRPKASSAPEVRATVPTGSVDSELRSVGLGAFAGSRVSRLIAGYDAAQTSVNNEEHWKWADALDAKAANSLQVRKILRERGRYESGNNSWAYGMIQSAANDLVGVGPTIQFHTPNDELNEQLEQMHADWMEEISLPEKLITCRRVLASDGEAFAFGTTNRSLDSIVKLDMRLVECDQISTPRFDPLAENAIDGIEFDDDGNPRTYHRLKAHPGSDRPDFGKTLEYKPIPAAKTMHWFRMLRPGQLRGIPELTPALPLFALLRRYTLATLHAAETAAKHAGVIQSNVAGLAPAEGQEWEEVPLDMNSFTVLPYGWQLGQLKAEQPTTMFDKFERAILNQIARCLILPLNIAIGNSSGYNYSSGRLDHQSYFRHLEIDQRSLQRIYLNPMTREWVRELSLIADYRQLRELGVRWTWMWPGREHVDPEKESNAQETQLNDSWTTSIQREMAKKGVDWRKLMRERLEAEKYAKKIGLVWAPGAAKAQPVGAGAGAGGEEGEQEGDE